MGDYIIDLMVLPFIAAFLYLLYITPRGIRGHFIIKRIKKGKLRKKKNYFPLYFSENDAEDYQESIQWRAVLILSMVLITIFTLSTVVLPAICILVILIVGWKVLKLVSEKRKELKQKFGKAEFPQKYRLYKAVGTAATVEFGYTIIFFVFVLVGMFLGLGKDSDEDAARQIEYEWREREERERKGI